jgi:hypothetical protein
MSTYVFDQCGMADPNSPLKPKQTIEKVLHNLSNTIENKFPNQINYLVDTTWLEWWLPELLKDYKKIGNIDNVFLCSTVDVPTNPKIPFFNNQNLNVYQIGNVIDNKFEKYRFDFWAISVNDLFETYTETDLRIDFNNLKYFLCYQNKPHDHRQLFVYKILNLNIQDKGILTLQKFHDQDFLYPNLKSITIDENVDRLYFFDPMQLIPSQTEIDRGIPYSLGDVNIWKQCFLNVVSETVNNSSSILIVSEKTWKPILGMRPFVINGNREILNYLDKNNFYTFEEYWPDVDFRSCKTMADTVECCVQVVNKLCRLSEKEIKLMYLNMYPKLVHNRNRFFQFAKEQELKTTTLFDDINHDINN